MNLFLSLIEYLHTHHEAAYQGDHIFLQNMHQEVFTLDVIFSHHPNDPGSFMLCLEIKGIVKSGRQIKIVPDFAPLDRVDDQWF